MPALAGAYLLAAPTLLRRRLGGRRPGRRLGPTGWARLLGAEVGGQVG